MKQEYTIKDSVPEIQNPPKICGDENSTPQTLPSPRVISYARLSRIWGVAHIRLARS
ncbi:hypothetical protein VIBNISFn118_2300001 [Vibrio nigripulchritudo SFn118]|nr:hypothetical protein VIBNISFn118_2300001 [Vibrio nigripulchritudo SFn118]